MRQSRLADRVNALLKNESAVDEMVIPGIGGGLALLILAPPTGMFETWLAVAPVGVTLFIGFALAVSALMSAVVLGGGLLIFVLRLTWRGRFVVAGVAVAGWVVALWRWGPGSVEAGVATAVGWVLPAVFVLVCALWMLYVAWRVSGGHDNRWARPALRVFTLVVSTFTWLALLRRDLVTTLPAAGLLFPVGVWFSFWAWRKTIATPAPARRAGADLVLALLLGGHLVLLLVWAVNLLDLSPAQVRTLRDTMKYVGEVVEVRWWWWALVYLLLAGLWLLLVLRPKKVPEQALERLHHWLERTRLTAAVGAARRVLIGTHFGLLVAVLIGLSGPTVLRPLLRDELHGAYTVAYQRELHARGLQAAYARIRDRFTAGNPPQPLSPLAGLVHTVSYRQGRGVGPEFSESVIARHFGETQAEAVAASLPHAEAPRQPPAPPSLADDVAATEAEQRRAKDQRERVDAFAEAAAVAITSHLSINDLPTGEVIQILHEYFTGLFENTLLRKTLATWAERQVQINETIDKLIIPDPQRMKAAAEAGYLHTHPHVSPDVIKSIDDEPPLDAVADLTGQLDETSSGDGGGGTHPGKPGEHENPEPKIPEPRIRVP
jgi:hypothetical protein